MNKDDIILIINILGILVEDKIHDGRYDKNLYKQMYEPLLKIANKLESKSQ